MVVEDIRACISKEVTLTSKDYFRLADNINQLTATELKWEEFERLDNFSWMWCHTSMLNPSIDSSTDVPRLSACNMIDEHLPLFNDWLGNTTSYELLYRGS